MKSKMSVGICYNKPHKNLFHSSPYKRDIQKVKRQLFGPVDHDENHRFVTQELEKHYTFQSERWNFDFKNERSLSQDGLYDWRPVTPVKIAMPKKRRPTEIEYDTHTLYCLPEDMFKSKSMMNRTIIEEQQTPLKDHKTQSLITDFMQIKKNSSSDTMKKLTARPCKIPRLGNELKS